tara:strand:- start:476 stop:1003 length:528 start_codon:yes stop_codon:yes gene_type:complete
MVLNYSVVEGYDSKIPDTTDIINKIESITNKLATHVLSEADLKGLMNNINLVRTQIKGSSNMTAKLKKVYYTNLKTLTDLVGKNKNLLDLKNKSSSINGELSNTNKKLQDNVTRNKNLELEIKKKEKDLLTRERMLQLSIEKNVYKKKMIYTYIALISLILLLLFSAYFYYKSKA